MFCVLNNCQLVIHCLGSIFVNLFADLEVSDGQEAEEAMDEGGYGEEEGHPTSEHEEVELLNGINTTAPYR